jgi:hypothetical protein
MVAIAALVGAGLGGTVAALVGVLVLGTEATLTSGLHIVVYLGSIILFALTGAAVAIRVVVRSNNSLQRP